jgi:hypothetical protein
MSDDLRALVASLDAKVAAAEVSSKFVINVWTTARKICADATRSKIAALRVRDSNPHHRSVSAVGDGSDVAFDASASRKSPRHASHLITRP